MARAENWIRLAKLESPKRAAELLHHFGDPDAVFAARIDGFPGFTPKSAERFREIAKAPVDEELRALDRSGARIVTVLDPEYPENLRDIHDPPPVLFVRGRLAPEDRTAVAVVGTRRPTEYGRSMAMRLSRDLARAGVCIASGGALGIDTVAHSAVVAAGGRTVAVLGCGLDVPYPASNKGLFAKIAEHGAVISEFAPTTEPLPWRFPARNRLISGLSVGVLVIESRVGGGSMITATHAAEQGRDVWAVPGGTDSAASEGPHRLIREGAKLVERAEDILEELKIDVPTEPRPEFSPEEAAVYSVLTLHPKHADEISSECGLSAQEASGILTILEMRGLVRRVPGSSYVRT
ncbi:MAG: DNA-processing protein DprA [Armatimonadota bacterium]